MKPASFEYYSPASVAEALALLQQHASDARLLAGGQSLVPMMNFRLVAPAVIVDLNRIPELAYIEDDGDVVRIGAMTRQRTAEFSTIVGEKLPLLREAIKLVGHLPTRSRGTIGGTIAHADPSAEIPMVFQALEGDVVARGPQGERITGAADFFRDALTTSLAPDEMLVEVRWPAMPPGAGYAVEEFSRRHGDFAIAAIAAVVVRDSTHCTKARLATAGISAHSVRLRAAEEVLEAEGLGESAVARAADIAAGMVEPLADQNASAEFRRHLTRVLTSRALCKAIAGAA
jgi:aerobic carbon-monoxide dehydrogenase medium subunit